MRNNKYNKKVYVGLSADILHKGHINILKIAKKYGDVIVGLLTDEAIASYKNIPYLNYEKRKIVLENIKYVKKVIPQKTLDYVENLNLVKPDYVVHADDWKSGIQKKTRDKVIKTLKKWSGKLIEPQYTKNISSTMIKKQMTNIISSPDNRVSRLKRLLHSKDIVRILESHNSLTGLIIDKINIIKDKKIIEFDGMWSSSLTDSATKGLPDNSSLSFSARISSLQDMLDVTSKPVVFDADNGGQIEHLPFLVRSLERSGVSAIIMEDKIGLKKNSLFKNQSGAKQDKPNDFAKKIKKICSTRQSKDFLAIARIESFILGKGIQDALKRAVIYSKAGADAILIHSKEKTPKEIFSFAKEFKKSKYFIPLVSVPSTYSKVYEKDLINNGFKLVIYANQLLRAAYPAMQETAKTILKNSRAFEADKKIIPIKEIISLIKND
ncbi:phosphoenolpyruvate mutase [Candidatus Pelagibacter sp.]|jgi:phosphoenolpyruvate phosphomutase / 2-hydroxyethylphosphonate cytidylyltransferase|nr:phosphoenolpyruvate mutase [Candidatus Pelagibacter sp.]MDC1483486.1 phosphoenolpyruvate mutase [Pelagibacteraceae bacterium]